MEGENEVTVVVEDTAAASQAQATADIAHAEARVEVAQVEAERDMAIAETHAEAAVAVAEAQAQVASADMSLIIGRLDTLAAENAALRIELSELRSVLEDAADEIEEELREEIRAEEGHATATDEVVNAIESGEVPTPVPNEEPVVNEEVHRERKRHFIRI